jgi:hypothetical protein
MLVALRRVTEERLSLFPSMKDLPLVVEGIEEYLDGSTHKFVAGWNPQTKQWDEAGECKLPRMYWNNFDNFPVQSLRSWFINEWFATQYGDPFSGAEKPEVPETHHLWE